MILDISSRKTGLERELSNFIERRFILDDVVCGSMEGFLQALKFYSPNEERSVAALVGYKALKMGQNGNGWKITQCLSWSQVLYHRDSRQYQELLTRAYDAQFDQNPRFREALRETVGCQLRHSSGKTDSQDTVLTEREYINQLERLRWRTLEEVNA